MSLKCRLKLTKSAFNLGFQINLVTKPSCYDIKTQRVKQIFPSFVSQRHYFHLDDSQWQTV